MQHHTIAEQLYVKAFNEMGLQGPFKFKWFKDPVKMFKAIKKRKTTLGFSRTERYRPETEAWLEEHDIEYKALFMRPAGDKRKDTIVKREIFDREIRDKYAVLFVLDDRISVCRQWYGMGLPLLRVGDPDADF